MATIIKGKNKNKPYTVRYYHDGRQGEKSFKTAAEARSFKADFEFRSRDQTFVDPRVANTKFEEVARDWLARHPGKPKSLKVYEMVLRLHILPTFGAKGLAKVAGDRDGVERFLRETLPAKGLGASSVRTCYMVINAIINDAIKSGKLTTTRLRGIKLPAVAQRAHIEFATHDQIETMAQAMPDPYGFSVYLMRGCGLRLGEALGVQASDFIDGGDTLRLQRQMLQDGSDYGPLKHRDADDYRDLPVPVYVDGAEPMGFDYFPAVSHRQFRYWFNRARDLAGLSASLTPHTLRHQFASVCLAGGVPITDVSKWLGHRSIQVTFGIYGHLVPASWERARKVLDEEWKA